MLHINKTNVLVRAWEEEHSTWGLTGRKLNPDHGILSFEGSSISQLQGKHAFTYLFKIYRKDTKSIYYSPKYLN